MKTTSASLRIMLCALTPLTVVSSALAPPPGYTPGYHWADRALAYAVEFCDGTNPEYERFEGVDCANFTSQIANAGCSGMCESNDTDWPGWTAPDSTCWDYHSTEPHSNTAHGCNPQLVQCVDCPTGWHSVISNARAQCEWFYCSDSNYVYQAVGVRDSNQIPDFVQKGCFAFRARWDSLQQQCKWHAVFVGSGSGQGARFYAHTTERCGATVKGLFRESGFDHVEFYRARVFSPTDERTK